MRLIKNFFLNSSYQVLLIILPIITAPYISRVLGTEGVGIYSFTGANGQYFILFAVLGTATYGNREIAYHQNDKVKRSEIFWGITILSWITASISLLLFLIFIYFNKDYKNIYIWQSLLILSSLFDISWYFMGREKFSITVTRNFVFKIFTVIAIFTFVKKPSDLALYVAIMCLGGLISSLSLWPFLREEVYPPNIKKLNLKHHLRYTILLFLPTIATQIYIVANRTMIGMMDSITHAGFYQQSDTIIKLALSLVGTIGVVMMPRVANMFSKGNLDGINNSIIKTFNIALGISFGIFFGILAISLKFAPFFFGESFSMVGIIMMIESPIILFIPISNVFGTQYLLPLNRMKEFTLSVTLGAILNIIINLILIPLYGVIGATIATVISELAVTCYQYFLVRKEFKLKKLFGGIWKYLLSGIVMFIIVFVVNQQIEMNIFNLIIQIVIGACIYVLLNITLKTNLWVIASNLFFKKLK